GAGHLPPPPPRRRRRRLCALRGDELPHLRLGLGGGLAPGALLAPRLPLPRRVGRPADHRLRRRRPPAPPADARPPAARRPGVAPALGIHPDGVRVRLLLLVALCIGVVVSASGSLGFVGLVIPHLARRVVGSAHRHAVPVAALMGAIFLLWADLVARTILAPQEIPLGILTSLVGAPFLLILIRRMHVSST